MEILSVLRRIHLKLLTKQVKKIDIERGLFEAQPSPAAPIFFTCQVVEFHGFVAFSGYFYSSSFFVLYL